MSDDKKTRADEVDASRAHSLSRRNLLKGVGLTGAALMTAGSGSLSAQSSGASASAQRIPVREAFETLTALESSTLDAFASRIIPSDENGPEAGFARQFAAQGLELLIDHVLAADRGGFVRVARPQLEGVLPAEADVEAAFDVALLARREAGELAKFGDGERGGPGIRHDEFPCWGEIIILWL